MVAGTPAVQPGLAVVPVRAIVMAEIPKILTVHRFFEKSLLFLGPPDGLARYLLKESRRESGEQSC